MNVLHLYWLKQGNADQVCIFVDIPQNVELSPDYFGDTKLLKLYGKRTGKLRAEIIPYFQLSKDITKLYHNGNYTSCKDGLNVVKFKHLIPQVEKHLSWAMLSV